jgi:hypothetical protein
VAREEGSRWVATEEQEAAVLPRSNQPTGARPTAQSHWLNQTSQPSSAFPQPRSVPRSKPGASAHSSRLPSPLPPSLLPRPRRQLGQLRSRSTRSRLSRRRRESQRVRVEPRSESSAGWVERRMFEGSQGYGDAHVGVWQGTAGGSARGGGWDTLLSGSGGTLVHRGLAGDPRGSHTRGWVL